MYNVIIIGGMAAGCKAAARLSRLSSDYQITIIERKPIVSFGNCGLPLYAAGEVDDLYDLAKTGYGAIRDADYFNDVKAVNVLTKTEVVEINSDKSEVTYKAVDDEQTATLHYNALIIATGSQSVVPGFPLPKSSEVSSFHSALDAKNFRETAQKGKVRKVVIAGGGFIGCELTEALRSLWGIETILIEKEEALLSKFLDREISRLVENRIEENGVHVLLSSEIEKIENDEKDLPVVNLTNGTKIESDYLFYNLGVLPETDLAESAGVKIGKLGGIIADKQMKTNIPNIWAAGDCVETNNLVTGKPDYFSLGSLSNRMGRVAANSIAGRDDSFNGAAGTISLQVFDLIISATGLTEQKAKEHGYNTGTVIGCWSDRPDYHPDSKDLFGKLIYEKESLKLLGIQLVGEGEVNRYVDVVSELLANNKTVYDLENLEHGYMPAHSSPISPLNFLGYMVINQEKENVKNVSAKQVSSFDGLFIDLRESEEIDSSAFSHNAVHIPLADLRKKRDDFDLDAPIMFICEKGPRSLEAARIFMNFGYRNVSYLGGGNTFYKEVNKSVENSIASKKEKNESINTLN
ncbi:MAG: FAD-dependent oxidoreductase [Ignavibacteriaceae bacterium]|nr:FAD-dependent oxidoreductase [Ignavibacteriaceae bacterium]